MMKKKIITNLIIIIFGLILFKCSIRGRKDITLSKANHNDDNNSNILFSLNYKIRDKLHKGKIIHADGINTYGYKHKGVSIVIPLVHENKIKDFFSVSDDENSCSYYIYQHGVSTNKYSIKCYQNNFCGILPNNKYITEIKNDLLYCAHFNSKELIIYHISEPELLKPDVVYQEIVFLENKKKILINCNTMFVDIISINSIPSKYCLNDYLLLYGLKLCTNKTYCHIDFSKFNVNSCPINDSYILHIKYKCKDQPSHILIQNDSANPKIKYSERICKYGYNIIQNSLLNNEIIPNPKSNISIYRKNISNKCEKNYTCGNKVCSVNQYCDEVSETCKCKKFGIPINEQTCEPIDVCQLLNCPENSICVQNKQTNKAECKCNDNKYFYQNKCYYSHEFEDFLKLNSIEYSQTYIDKLYTGSSLKSEHIFMKCPKDFEIEIVNAYITCYNIPFSLNSVHKKRFTSILKKECNGKNKCVYGSSTDNTEMLHSPNICTEDFIYFKYNYLCKEKEEFDEEYDEEYDQINENNSEKAKPGLKIMSKTIPKNINEHAKIKENKHATSYIKILKNTENSKIECIGGKIQIHSAIIKGGPGCEDLNITNSVQTYCNDTSNCDIGSMYKFDTYCINNQYLYISYECKNLCTFCTSDSSCYGNKFDYRCFCDYPYISKNKLNSLVCEIPTSCSSIKCRENEECKNANGYIYCDCIDGYNIIDGVCQKDVPCFDQCPTNKKCVVVKGKHVCKCINRSLNKKGKPTCYDSELDDDYDVLYASRNKCKKKEYINMCNKNKEVCVYYINTDEARCECKDHFARSPKTNECEAIGYCDNINCKANEECIYSNGKGECVCKNNFSKNGEGKCVYNNLCTVNNGNCTDQANCIYHEDKPHECTCKKEGYIFLNNKCVIRDKCSEKGYCSDNSICINVLNKEPMCVCTFNYIKKNDLCVLKNPCLFNNGNCPKNSVCKYQSDKTTCTCTENYAQKNNICEPLIDQTYRNFLIKYNEDPYISLGACGIIYFIYNDNQILWKINSTEEFYIFDYTFPNNENVNVYIKNKNTKTILYLEKMQNGNSKTYDDFVLDHLQCSYTNMFFMPGRNRSSNMSYYK
ncbi:Rh5 interacting protein, putative [Plasmodium berghei]|uniref:Rh5 interacting protein, putative n=2 Tax=Plasmodium berghei TaxID=5821 RepID=A0A509ANC3_PLABA|nr:Rh5 interacting protein, putative [Plasmodium berghei ANKA]CXI75949.1 Rh5 interacting protein, putative [Plasmodium berghei]SCM24876.1 Rh5 interacting protein, putative [Plasmodium berghei]SCN27195.1 Rh5 interacting protein, putative [Plasmodium berghei]SCO61754.1 Rh5 interacting protein, putative [Plasmodium berghei]SCO63618.1 Rh5 interacting protein, putative [Plasmodium berghei]|eukprot:XP_034422829.1 Rh5 interacting protein, putative [Plasmodium berghei ANKA]